MSIEIVKASSIQAALAEARRQFGDEIVLLESRSAANGKPAQITIMRSDPLRDAAGAAARLMHDRGVQAHVPFGYQGGRKLTPPATTSRPDRRSQTRTKRDDVDATRPARTDADDAAPNRQINNSVHQEAHGTRSADSEDRTGAARPGSVVRPTGAEIGDDRSLGTPKGEGGRRPFFSFLRRRSRNDAGVSSAAASGMPEQATGSDASVAEHPEAKFDEVLKGIHAKIVAAPAPGAATGWQHTELYVRLCASGVSQPAINELVRRLEEAGLRPQTDPGSLLYAAEDALRAIIRSRPAGLVNGAQMFIGAAHAGKTSLILKLAKSPDFFGRKRVAVVVISTPGLHDRDITRPYRELGIAATTVTSIRELKAALVKATARFDQVFMDTPALPAEIDQALSLQRRTIQIVKNLRPLSTYLVVDASKPMPRFTASFVEAMRPAGPDALALTHMDRARPGNVAGWLSSLNVPVAYVSSAASLTSGVARFSKTNLIRQILRPPLHAAA